MVEFDKDDEAVDEMSTWIPPAPRSLFDGAETLRQALVDGAAAAPPPFAPDGYEMLGVIGRGGMSVVYKGRQVALNRITALKVLPASHANAPGRLARFQTEAQAAARLAHPRFARIFEVGSHGGQPYLALEYIAGGSLADRLAGAPLPPKLAAAAIAELALAMHAAHELGIVHRDLKPSNVLVDSPREDSTTTATLGAAGSRFEPQALRIVDLGLARYGDAEDSAPSLTQDGTILGTPSYMAPEQASGRSHVVGPEADIYALGAMLYEMLTGRPPFRADSVLATLEQVRTHEPAPPIRLQPKTPRDLQTICLKCLEKDPARRYATAAALAQDLDRFLDGRSIVARPAGPIERAAKWAKRKPALASLVAVCAFSLVAGAVAAAAHQRRLGIEIERVKEEKAAAERQERRADANYRSARDALRGIVARLQERSSTTVPQVVELRAALLDEALAFYLQALARLEKPDREVSYDAAQALEQSASVQIHLARYEPAEANLRRAIEILNELCANHPQDARYFEQAAQTENELGTLHSLRQRYAPAAEHHERALSLCPSAAKNAIEPPERTNLRARLLHNLAVDYYGLKRRDEGERCYRQSLAERRGLLTRDGRFEWRLETAETALSFAAMLGFTEEAASLYAEAEEWLAPAAAERPGDHRLAVALASVRLNRANGLVARGDRSAAEALYQQAIDGLLPVRRAEPNFEQAKAVLLLVHGARAKAYESNGQFDAAVVDWNSVVELANDDLRDAYRTSRMLAMARAGEHAQAIEEANELGAEPSIAAADLYNLACVAALCAASAAAEPALQADYREQAWGLLRRARDLGFFGDPAMAALFCDDADLAALRNSAAYDEFLAGMQN